jgi:hypothetical protein
MENRKVIAVELFEQSMQEADFLLMDVTGDESCVLTMNIR